MTNKKEFHMLKPNRFNARFFFFVLHFLDPVEGICHQRMVKFYTQSFHIHNLCLNLVASQAKAWYPYVGTNTGIKDIQHAYVYCN
jgi:hypothetical protein